jgi:hypothetical protein
MKFLIALFILSHAYAELTLDACHTKAKAFIKKGVVPSACFSLVDSSSASHLRAEYVDGDKAYQAMAYKSMLFIRVIDNAAKKTNVHLISGPNSGLNDIQSLSFSPYNERIAVLNRDTKGESEIRIFHRDRNGNVGPHKLIQLADLSDAKNISYHNSKKELWVVRNNGRLFSVSSESDSRKKVEKFKPVVLMDFDLKNMTGVSASSMVVVENRLLILDEAGKNILSYEEPLEGKTSPDLVIELKNPPNEASHLDYISGKVLVRNPTGELLEVDFTSNFVTAQEKAGNRDQ